MGFPPPRPPRMVNPDRPWPRPDTPRAPLDATSSETLELWCAQPEWDMRSLEEFAEEGGRPLCPPNRPERAPVLFSYSQALLGALRKVWAFYRAILKPERSRWRDYDPPPLPRFVPAPPPPSTPMTGYLRSSFDWPPFGIPGGAGGESGVTLYRGRPLSDEAVERIIETGNLPDHLPPPDSGGTFQL